MLTEFARFLAKWCDTNFALRDSNPKITVPDDPGFAFFICTR